MELTNNIRKVRESKRMTQNEVAEKLNVDNSNYAKQEKKGSKLSLEQLQNIADALGVTVVELITGEPPKIEDSGRVAELEKRVRELEDRISDKVRIIDNIDNQLLEAFVQMIEYFYLKLGLYKESDFYDFDQEFDITRLSDKELATILDEILNDVNGANILKLNQQYILQSNPSFAKKIKEELGKFGFDRIFRIQKAKEKLKISLAKSLSLNLDTEKEE